MSEEVCNSACMVMVLDCMCQVPDNDQSVIRV